MCFASKKKRKGVNTTTNNNKNVEDPTAKRLRLKELFHKPTKRVLR